MKTYTGKHGHLGFIIEGWNLLSRDDQLLLNEWRQAAGGAITHVEFRDRRDGIHADLLVEFHDIKEAMRFKLTWGGI